MTLKQRSRRDWGRLDMIYKWGELIALEYGKPVKDKARTDGQYPVYGTNGQIGTSNLTPLCDHPSFILGRKGAYRGVHYSSVPFSVIDTAFYAVNLHPDILDIKWAYYRFLTYDINSMDSGSAIPSTDRYEIYAIEVDLPDIDEQKREVKLLECFDDKIANITEINDNLYAQAKAIFADRFINLLSVPDGWRKGNLLDIANYLNGLAMQKFRPHEGEIGLPVLKIKELRQGSCDNSSELCSPSIKSDYIIHDGDVIFSWSGSLLVDIWCGGNCGLNQHLFKVTSDVYDKWFYYLWTAHHLDRFIAIAADKATTMGHIKREELSKAEVLIPSEEAYKEISSIMQPNFKLMISNRIEARKLAALRDELLPKLMSGEIDVSEVSL